MTHPETPEVGGEPIAPAAEPQDAFMEAWENSEPLEADGTVPEEQEPTLSEDDIPTEEEADDLPPIEPPVSWDAEAKAKFAELPRELQETVTKRETERERFVQQKSQEATRAKQDALQTATAELAQIEQQYAQSFQQMAAQLQPQRPDPAMLSYDQQGYYNQLAAYENAQAQQQQLQQQAYTLAQQAQQRQAQIEQAEMAEQHRIIVEAFPEYADPTTGPELQRKLSAVAKRIGYPDELISQARAQDIIAMRAVAEAVEKADRYDALMKNKMAKVRDAKRLPKVATPGVPQGGDQLRANRAQAAFENAKANRLSNAGGEAFYDYLKASGHI